MRNTLRYPLLSHPFYQAWMTGDITPAQLVKYHSSYMEFIEKIPLYWSKVADAFAPEDEQLQQVITEEYEHIGLWKKWGEKMPKPDEFPRMDTLIDTLDDLGPDELLGAVHVFEIQQPAVAKTKKEALLKWFGFHTEDLHYFDEHMDEQEHIAVGKRLAKKHADPQKFSAGFEQGGQLVYQALGLF